MANKPYQNFVLAAKLEDFYKTKLDLNQFITINDELMANEGDKYVVNTYTATGDVEDLAMGQGNTAIIEASFTPAEYLVKTTQGQFVYYDEEINKDTKIVSTGLEKLSASLVNNLTTSVVAELDKTTLSYSTAKFDYASFANAIAVMNFEDETGLYALVNVKDLAEIRTNFAEELKYVEANVRTGYIGTACGVPISVSKAVPQGKIYIATTEAVTCFNKKGAVVEQDRDIDKRKNTVVGRVVRVIALTDGTKVVKMVKTEAAG